MGTTPTHSLPYPEPSAMADVPTHLRALAEAVEVAVGPGGAGSGNVVGPVSATDNAVARFDTAAGDLIQGSLVTIGDTGRISGVVDGVASADVATKGQVDAAVAATGLAASGALSAHATDTAGVHGIPDTATLITASDPRLTDSRRPVYPVVAAATAYTATANDCLILADASAAAATITLPATASGVSLIVKKIDPGVYGVNVAGSNGALIDGTATFPLTAQFQSVTVISDGTNWHVA